MGRTLAAARHLGVMVALTAAGACSGGASGSGDTAGSDAAEVAGPGDVSTGEVDAPEQDLLVPGDDAGNVDTSVPDAADAGSLETGDDAAYETEASGQETVGDVAEDPDAGGLETVDSMAGEIDAVGLESVDGMADGLDAGGLDTAEDVAAEADAGKLASCYPTDGLVGLWSGEGSGEDSVGTNGGTLIGDVSFAPGVVGQAFEFPDGASFVLGAGTTGLPLGDSRRTLVAWVKVDSTSEFGGIIFHYGQPNGDAPPTNFHLLLSPAGFAVIGNGFGYGTADGTTTVVGDGKFHLLAGVYEGPLTNMARIYVDGVEEGAAVITPPGTAAGGFAIAQELPDPHMIGLSGLVDEVAVYARVLSADEIAAMATCQQ